MRVATGGGPRIPRIGFVGIGRMGLPMCANLVRLDRSCEALAAVTAMARERRVPFELSDLVHRTYQRALAGYGAVDGEPLAVALLEEQAGVRLRDG